MIDLAFADATMSQVEEDTEIKQPSRLIDTLQLDSSSDTNVTPTSGPLEEFTVFEKLPVELRLKIWHTLSGPRIIEVVYGSRGFRVDCPPPITFYVCAESRTETMKKYKILDKECAIGRAKSHIRTYINPDQDMLYLSLRAVGERTISYFSLKRLIDCLETCAAEILQRIALPWQHFYLDCLYYTDKLAKFEMLESVHLVFGDNCIPLLQEGPGLRRAAIGYEMRSLKEVKTAIRWNNKCQKPMVSMIASSFLEKLEEKLLPLKARMVESGADKTFVENLEFVATDIIRSELGQQSTAHIITINDD